MGTSTTLSLKPLTSQPLSFPTYPPTLTLTLTQSKIWIPPLSSSSKNTGSPSDCPVPLDQQPINEYQSLADSSWAAGDVVEYYSRLFATGACFALFVGLPVSWVGSKHEPIKLALGSASSGLFVAILAVVRMYLGWAYVGNRLLSATVEYEETGWYDGQIWVKTAEVLARDRLLGSFSVKPVLSRLKKSLVILGISLLICILLFINLDDGQKNANMATDEGGSRVIPRVYDDESARNFEPHAFCGSIIFLHFLLNTITTSSSMT